MFVKGTVLIEFSVDVGTEDISTSSMTIQESDRLLTEAINTKLPSGFEVLNDICVKETRKDTH
jgi:hypothetical protein